MKRKILLFMTVIGIALLLHADNHEDLQALQEQKSELMLKMHHKRIELIKKNPSLMELQKKIIALHKELAIRIDNNEEMRILVDKLRDIETQIRVLGGGDE